jgi:hypothetical protein
MGKVFLSYRHVKPDEDLASFIRQELLAHGHKPFIDAGIGIGEDWVCAIDSALRAADSFIVLLSKDSILSDMVRKEIELAWRLSKRLSRPLKILPLRVDYEGELPYDLGAYLDRIHYALWKPGMDYRSLVARLLDALDHATEAPEPGFNEIDYSKTDALFVATEKDGAPLPVADPRLVAKLERGTLHVGSPFYVRRRCDALAEECLKTGEATTIVKGSRQMGKSSLLARLHAQAKASGRKSLYLDFQLVDSDTMARLDRLARFLARTAAREFGLAIQPKDTWDDDEGPIANLTNYLEDAVLASAREPVHLVLDEAERVFDYGYRDAFFAIFRGWHNQRAINERFQHLGVVIAHATTPTLWIQDINQSPFNVGTSLALRGFNSAELQELNSRYGHPIKSDRDIEELFNFLGGHPYLTRLALYVMARSNLRLQDLIRVAGEMTGPFADHLRGIAWLLRKSPDLRAGLLEVVKNRTCTEEMHFQRLWAAGLIQGEARNACMVSCRLYEQYLTRHL